MPATTGTTVDNAVMTDAMTQTPTTVEQAKSQLDAHVREIINWHFSDDTGCPFWLDWKKNASFNPLTDVGGIDDLIRLFPHSEDDWMRFEHPHRWVPQPYQGKAFTIFETGGTTGMPKQRIGWDDYKFDYEQFSETLNEKDFPRGGYWK